LPLKAARRVIISDLTPFGASNLSCRWTQKMWKSVKIWQSYREYKGGNFFWDTMYIVYFGLYT